LEKQEDVKARSGFNSLRLGGLLFFVGGAQFLLLTTLAESLYPNYSVRNNFLSDLGVVEPSGTVWNTSIFLSGLLFLIGAYLLFRSFGRPQRLALAMYVLAGVGAMATGLLNENAFPDLHQIVSLIAFIFGGISAIVTYRLVQVPFKYVSPLLGAFTLVSLVLLIARFRQQFGNGLMERLVAFPEIIWLMAFGGYLMNSGQD
jgi:hypothetical membrane protein